MSGSVRKETRAMRILAVRKARALLSVMIVTAGLTLGSSTVAAAPVAIDLCASTGEITLPDSTTVDVWGFVQTASCGPDLVTDANFPGDPIAVNDSDAVTINLDSALPAGQVLQFEIPGITFDPGLVDGSAAITFTADDPGSYLFQSTGGGGRQTAMGLYGALIVRPAAADQAYDDGSTAYDVEATLVLSQIDPEFNAAPDTFDMKEYLATHWLINGKAYPDTAAIAASAGERVLLRLLNAGYDNTSMTLVGTRLRVVGRSARLLANPVDAVAETVPAGATEDAIVTVPAFPPPTANGFPLFNRNLHVTNGSGATYDPTGGMMTFIVPTP